jgi:hypothetical protein
LRPGGRYERLTPLDAALCRPGSDLETVRRLDDSQRPVLFPSHIDSFFTLFFFFFAAAARKAVWRHFAIILPGSSRLANYLRTFQTFYNFVWTLADAAVHRLLSSPFNYEFKGEKRLNELASSKAAIVLTAHMGNYDLGATLFAEKFQREIRLVRAPEPDPLAAQHIDLSLKRSSGGAVKIDYNTAGASLSLDLFGSAAKRADYFHSRRPGRRRCHVFTRHAFRPGTFAANRTLRSFTCGRSSDLPALYRSTRLSKIQDHRTRADHLLAHQSAARGRRRRRDATMVSRSGRNDQ